MPFTLAHPAAVIPLRGVLGAHTILSGLVIGSMVPDGYILLPAWLSREQTHSLWGLALFCVPVGLIFHLLYTTYLRPVAGLVVAGNFLPSHSREVDALPSIAASILIGATTHLIWDAFTNTDGAFILALGVRKLLLFKIDGAWFYVNSVLHISSSVLGFGFVLYWMWRQSKKKSSNSACAKVKLHPGIRIIIITLPVFAALAVALMIVYETTFLRWSLQLANDWLVWTMRLFLPWWLGLGMVYKYWFEDEPAMKFCAKLKAPVGRD